MVRGKEGRKANRKGKKEGREGRKQITDNGRNEIRADRYEKLQC